MARQGRLTEWNDERGFGFITPLDGRSRLFAHVSEFPREQRRPYLNDLVVYSTSRDERGRLRAERVTYLVPAHSKHSDSKPQSPAVFLAVAAFLVLFATLSALGLVPVGLLGVYALASVVAFFMYGADKLAAEKGRWRTSEASLHLVALLGGWPGALLAQRFFRHKTIKPSFQAVFWATVVANCLLLLWISSSLSIASG
ncbi:MAG: DUF1294 domain-containing protein [Actinobacteria bacterium HGW-Actinobacteria-7]|jgi:uncharacterized membrane protein YsdA (DUF1294 family)/cold shock CspA family protein|nr:MAG: DUF1294 domain-containing protein [Actinobacteria bacterium HGW-Actinobacteria-7]